MIQASNWKLSDESNQMMDEKTRPSLPGVRPSRLESDWQ